LSEDKETATMRSVAVKRFWPALTLVLVLSGLILSGLVFQTRHKGREAGSVAGTNSGSGQDDLAISSSAKETAPASKPAPVIGADQKSQAIAAAEQARAQAAQQLAAAQQQAAAAAAVQQQQQAAAQQAAAAALAEKQRELDQKAAEQEAQARQLEQERLRMEAERQKAIALASVKPARPAPYDGPSSGTIVWQGEVKGTTLVTIKGNASDTGQVVSGGLPGVLVMIQPADGKHVGVAASPAPSNSYQRLTLRVQGNGMMQEVIRWSVP
jgi:multidrug efflux pump subunit AcrA (membrane-fusion protein)